MNDVSRADTLGFNRNRRRNHPARAVPGAEQSYMVNAIEQGNDCSYRIRISEGGKCRLQLRGLHRNPKRVNRRNFRSDGNIYLEIAESTFQTKLSGILLKRLASHDQA